MTKRRMYRVDRTDQLRALRSPTRIQMVAVMHNLGECSIREIAEQMGKPPDSLHYHARKMVALGLIECAGKRSVACRMESVYRLPGKDLEISLVDRSPEYLASVAAVYAAAFRYADRSMVKALAMLSGRKMDSLGPPGLIQLNVRMKRAAMKRLRRRLEELKEFIAENEDPGAGDTYLITIAHSARSDDR